ncbi:restriction endonuclease-related protein [Sphingobium sp. Leaf26]|uniref:restriction endonuclease-related protein n=1 Tax=Sphingobium sp. Leaf26 TaxID=1735693 RepID=UPI000A80E820|nr:hypothetical protein [Sphingobium sp. Leaf26]
MPIIMRRALARLSRHCIEDGVDDIGSSIHLLMEQATDAMIRWGVPSFAGQFRYSEVALVDGDLGVPTEDCRELARIGGSELDACEDLHHEQLRAAIQSYPTSGREAAYTAIREFVVRNPVVSLEALHRFMSDGHAHAARMISGLYRNIPRGAIASGAFTTCGRCGALLWPVRDPAYPLGRCQIRQCFLEGETRVGTQCDEPVSHRLASAALLAFWVGPGLDEIGLYDMLRAAGRQVALYPLMDAADVGIDGLAVGLDVKSYASPLVLGARLTRGIGRLAMFARKIIVVPDYKIRLNPRYLEDLRAAYCGTDPLEFMTVAQTMRAFAR